MIQEILDRDFVLEQLESTLRHLESQASSPSRRSLDLGPEAAGDLSSDDFASAAAAARQALAAETRESSGQPEAPASPSAPGVTNRVLADAVAAVSDEAVDVEPVDVVPEPSIDETAFFSRDPVVSLYQSVLEEYLETRQPEALNDLLPADRESDVAVPQDEPAANRSLFDPELPRQFSILDPGWVSQLFAQALTRKRGRRAFNAQPATPRTLQDRTRLLLVSDWGTGNRRARAVAAHMREHLDQGKAEGVEQSVAHLGDIYYAGREREVRKRFLRHWPVRDDEADTIASYSTNANHDMYSGGHAYYDVLLGDRRFAAQEKSSFCCLSNQHWRILLLDTGYEDKALQAPQPEWLKDQARKASRGGQKLCLLSHHQLFSAYESQHQDLIDAFEAIGSPHVDVWFWGHEHRLMTFEPHMNVQNARCIGHGGVPYYMKHDQDDPIPAPGEWEYRDFIPGRKKKERWAIFGFAILHLDGPDARVEYVNEHGVMHRREVLRF